MAIDYVEDKKIDVFLTSNATLLDEEHARELLKRKIDYISFSVDRATAETYEKIRLGAKFREVVDNIKRFCEIRDEINSKVTVELVPVIMIKENLHEVQGLSNLRTNWVSVASPSPTFITQLMKNPSRTKL